MLIYANLRENDGGRFIYFFHVKRSVSDRRLEKNNDQKKKKPHAEVVLTSLEPKIGFLRI